MALEEDRCGEGLGWLRESGRDAFGQLVATRDTEGEIGESRQEHRRFGQCRRIGNLSRQRERHRRRKMGVCHRADVRASGMNGAVDREIRRRGKAGPRRRLPLLVTQPDDNEIARVQFVLASAGRGDEEAVGVQSDGDVALAG